MAPLSAWVTLCRVAEAWEEYLHAKGDAEKKKVLAKFRKRENVLRSYFGKFYFKLKVYEEYLEQLRPTLEEVDSLNQQLERAKHPKTKKDAAIDTKAVHARLKQIEDQFGQHQRLTDELERVRDVVKDLERAVVSRTVR